MMEKIRSNKGMAINVCCAALMAILLFLQFVPFWYYGEAGETSSISSYIWFPSDHKELESWLTSQAENHDLNSFVAMPILTLVLSAIGTIFCLMKAQNGWTALLPATCGTVGTLTYLTSPALQLGSGWTWHLLLCIAVGALGVVGLIQQVKGLNKE